jgi:hypothetical protein
MDERMMRRTVRCMLALFVVGNCALGYGDYNQQMKISTDAWMQVVHGTAFAPDQYRIGVAVAAFWVTQHTPLRLSQVFGVFDLIASLTAVLLLFEVTRRTRAFQESPLATQWFGSVTYLALVMYLMEWTGWYRKVSTLPAACAVAVMLWLWTPADKGDPTTLRQIRIATAFFLVAVGLSFIRADLAFLVCMGILFAAVARVSPKMALPRGPAIATSAITGLTVGLVQLWLMKVVYPQATYGPVHVLMIVYDWWKLQKWALTLLFMTPFLWTLRQALQGRYSGEGAGGAFLFAALGYAVLWVTFGRLDEVRIFLPMAMAITPLTVELAMRKLDNSLDRLS